MSTSAPHARRAIWILLVALLGIGAATEAGTRSFVVKASGIERRVESEYAQAKGIHRTPGSQQVLVAGNSLLLTDVVFDSLRVALAPASQATRLVVEQTAYVDWLYGVKALLARGASPDVIALVLTRQQLVTSEFRGDYSAFRLMRPGDVPALAHDLRLHPTVASGYLLSTFSAFYGLRGELRKVLLSRLMPDIRDFTNLLPDRGVAQPFDSTTYRVAFERVSRLKQLVEGAGARLILIVPPTLGHPPADDQVLRAAADAGVPFLEPAAPGWFKQDSFADGFHMNERAAQEFTRMLTASLRRALDSSTTTSSPGGSAMGSASEKMTIR
jgi:hypothetical protein